MDKNSVKKNNSVIILHGAGRLSQIVFNMVESKYDQVFSYVDSGYLNIFETKNSFPVISSLETDLIGTNVDYISTIGYKNMEQRKSAYLDMCESLSTCLTPINIVHPTAYISTRAHIGVGNIFFPGVVIEDGVSIGDNNIFWSNACICHDAVIDSHSFFAASVTIGGHCHVGESCFLGFGSIVNETLNLAASTFLASGTVLIRDQPIVGARLCGVPAKQMKGMSS